MPTSVEQVDRALPQVVLVRVVVHGDRLDDLVTDAVHRIRARSARPGRSSRCGRRAPVAAASRSGRAGSRPSKRTWPVIVAVSGSSPRIASDVTDLPEPDSPTMPSVSDAREIEAHVVDRVDDAVVGLEVDGEIADREDGFAGHQCRDWGSKASRSASPRKLTASTVSSSIKPGNSTR